MNGKVDIELRHHHEWKWHLEALGSNGVFAADESIRTIFTYQGSTQNARWLYRERAIIVGIIATSSQFQEG